MEVLRLKQWCGDKPHAPDAGTAQTYAVAKQIGAHANTRPRPVLVAFQAAQAPSSSPSTAPTTSAQTPFPAASGLLSPAPSASPSLLPIPGIPPNGQGSLVAPSPRPSGTPSPSPVPLPSTSPTAIPSGPILIVRPSGTPSPLLDKGATPLPTGSASPAPSPTPSATAAGATPIPTLGPNEVITQADHFSGSTDERQPSDLTGNVHIFYVDGQIVGDRAHYDGNHTLLVSGHTYLVNRNSDSILYADSISFDIDSRKATLLNGAGESIEGVEQGKLHYTAQQLTTTTAGVSHGERATFTTCERPHAGYHVEARTIDVTPGERIILRKAVVFLGPLAIFYLPLLVIPLRSVEDPRRQQTTFVPVLGYSQIEGAFIKARLGFAPSNTYFGYYTIEYYTKRGLKLGYTAVASAKDGRRTLSVDANTIGDHIQNTRETNVNLQETENFSRTLRGQFGVNYQGDYGAAISLPASLNVTGSVVHQGAISTENFTFQKQRQGDIANNLNLGFVDAITLSQALQQQINLSYSSFSSLFSNSNTVHINTITHLASRFADYNLTYDKTNYSVNPNGYDRLPELQVLPRLDYHGFKYGPQLQFAVGDYTEPQNHFNTTRVQGIINEAIYAKVLGASDFQANYNLTQDYYGTGDEKAYDQQNASLTTPISNHFVNALTYNESHPIGPPDVPFQLFDRLSPGSHSAQEVLRFFNRDNYSLSLATGTNFNRQAQPVNYQLTLKPSPRSYLTFGGYFSPGPGNGFYQTNIQAITPFGLDTTLELTTNVDWKNKGRLTSKNVYLTRTIDQCYNLQLVYNEDLKQFNFNVTILAFPGQTAGFGIGGSGPSGIIPQSFANY